MQLEQRDDYDTRDGCQDIRNTLHDKVDLAAVIAFDGTVNRTDEQIHHSHTDRKQEREPRARGKAGQNILTALRRPEEEDGLIDAVLQMIGMVIDIVLVIVDTDLIARIGQAGVFVLFAVFAVPFDTDGVIIVVALLSDWMARIGENDVTVFIVDDLLALIRSRRVMKLRSSSGASYQM